MTSDKSSHSGSTALVAFGLGAFLTAFGGTALAGTGEHVVADGRADRLANRMSPWRACVADDGGAYFRETVMTPAKAPVSFTYGGKEHVGFGACKVLGRTLETKGVETTGKLRVQVDETLVVELEGAYRADFGESEWVLWFENPGTKPSKELSDVVCLRYDFLKCSEEWTCPRLRGIRGDHENLYRPYEIDCWNHPNGYRIDGSEGRPTHVEFPYFDLFTKEGGLLCALGWAGTWRADFDNVRDCPRPDWRFRVSFRACPSFVSVLLPGERIRSARVVLIPHRGSDIDHVSNLWRAWFRKYNEPKADAAGETLHPFSTANFAADTGKPNSDGSISEGHDTWRPTFDKIVVEKVTPDFRWFDAGWYVDPRGNSIPSVWWDVGTWALDAEKWPDGSLRSSVDAGHAVGMKTLVWFEPERVCDPPALVTNFGYRAEWALPYGPCFWRKEAVVAWNDIGDPQCFAWTRDRILAMMEANGIDLYREDHNFAPGPAWAEGDRRAEAKLGLPRKGMTETKGVMGHWALWDAIVEHGRRQNRCTFVDSCASGGGRNDLESLRWGVPLHRSDSDQATAGLRLSMTSSFCRWIPFHGACTKDVEGDYVVDDGPGASPYVFRASFLPVLNYGTRFVRNRNLDFALLRRNLAEWRSVADLLLKDLYVLTSWHPGDDRSVWTVLAYDDPEKGESIVLAFRQEEASYPSFEAVLKFADPACDYEIVNADTGKRETVSGKDLRTRGHLITLPQRKSSALLRLRRLKALVASEDAAWLLQTNLLERVTAPKGRSGLPKVLVLGDSISLGYTPFVKEKLAGVAEVSRPACNCGPSEFYLKNMRDWVGTDRWDVIHVNFGIWDNHYLKGPSDGMGLFWGREITNALPPIAKGTAIRDLGFGIRTPIKDYERNLRTILAFLKTHADKVVFGLTTPLKCWEGDDRCGRIRVYNELTTEVCRAMDVDVCDLYAVAERNLDKQTDGCHFSAEGYDALGDTVAKAIRTALAK